MVCNVQEVPSCPLAHCTQFPVACVVCAVICLALFDNVVPHLSGT